MHSTLLRFADAKLWRDKPASQQDKFSESRIERRGAQASCESQPTQFILALTWRVVSSVNTHEGAKENLRRIPAFQGVGPGG
jgi:hypothetical protein